MSKKTKELIDPSPERTALGKRIRFLREMANLTMEDLGGMMGRTRTIIYHWEMGHTKSIKNKNLEHFLKIIHDQGIQCSSEWLTTGKGDAPIYERLPQYYPFSSPLEITNKEEIEENIFIIKELKNFLAQNANTTHTVIPDDSMEPAYSKDDIVAGIKVYGKDIDSLIGVNCITFTKDGKVYVRRILRGTLLNHYNLTPLNPISPTLQNVELISAAAIIWARRKQPSKP